MTETRDKEGIWHVDGQKRFILASWGIEPVSFLPEYNVTVPDGKGMIGKDMLINRATIFGISQLRGKLLRYGATPEVLEGYRRIVNRTKNDSRLFAHYLCDEPDCFGFTATGLEAVAQVIADEDPYHPILISTGSNGITAYSKAGEINGFHCYPAPLKGRPMNQFGKIVSLMDKAKDYFKSQNSTQSIIYLHQGFNYGDCGVSPDSRIPSYEELRHQDLMALILGAVGLYHYNRTEMLYPELYLGIPEMLKEQKLIGEEAIIFPTASENIVSDKPFLRMSAKKNDKGYYWLLVCNASSEATDAKIIFPPLAETELTVISENRTVRSDSAGGFKDHFTPWQVHVYTNQINLPELKPIAKINAEIEEAHSRRRKVGNLAYQRNEGGVLTVTASSNKFKRGRNNATLWHLTDGVTAGPLASSGHSGGIIAYCDATPNQLPDWIEYEFPQPITISQVNIYPVNDSISDLQVQVWKNNSFITVKEVKNISGKLQRINFPSETTNRMRIVVTANRGKHTQIYEIEVYE